MFTPMPGAIAMVGMFSILVVEMVCNQGQPHLHGLGEDKHGHDSDDAEQGELALQFGRSLTSLDERDSSTVPLTGDLHGTLLSGVGQEDEVQKDVINVTLLEAGILFHSVFVGMSLSVTTGSAFVTLFIALTLHQFFEGLGLGSRIADIAFPRESWRPWIMATGYGISTPFGQAIGLVTRRLYDPGSAANLILVGVMNAISAGLLLYSSLVELLAEDFLSEHSYRTLRGRRRWKALGMVGLGAFVMALIGAFA